MTRAGIINVVVAERTGDWGARIVVTGHYQSVLVMMKSDEKGNIL